MFLRIFENPNESQTTDITQLVLGWTLRAAAHCPSHSLAEVSIRDLSFAIDEPTERGGTNLGPTPTDTAIAALVGCTNVIGHKCASKLGINIGHLDISTTCEFDRRGVTLEEEIDIPFSKISLSIETSEAVSPMIWKSLQPKLQNSAPCQNCFDKREP